MKLKYVLTLTSVLLSTALTASAGEINYLEVDNDVVIFSTDEAKTASSPACVQADNADQWTVSLASESGRAIYSLILTAMAKESMNLSVSSAQDCADSTGIERAANVFLAKVEEVPEPVEHDVNAEGTIMDSFFKAAWGRLENVAGFTSSSLEYYTDMEDHNGIGSAKWGEYKTNSKKKLVSLEGSGWVTSIILPYARVGDTVYLEIVVDGYKYEYTTTIKNDRGTPFMGVEDRNVYNERYDLGRIAIPGQVVAMNKGINYKQSIEVWLQMNRPSDERHSRWLVEYLEGESFR